ncbi:MAG: phosphoribosyltransferase [Euryarchaeota archaeon]|nr:phosphoribosyltransferase [Euryarchaeota archaeon]MDE1835380.1 phosphoribosyltransferase [Euryarchaeota archaeon]MDE1880483.1 phosphoribosyltransferase [Euryarchaeota archaeon]MDE2043676.1 phosphoribosyltransferase [Thermoplasmata archaeon]
MFAEPEPLFQDRAEVGRRLAARLHPYRRSGARVIALPRGGVVVGFEVATALELPLDVLIVRKLGHPQNPEFGIGALVEGAPPQWDEEMISNLGIVRKDLYGVLEAEELEVSRRVQVYRSGARFPDVARQTVLIVDDGVATGNTVRAAVTALRSRGARKLVVAIGVAPAETLRALRRWSDEVVCLSTPPDFAAVGQFFRNFDPVSDEEVVALLRRSEARSSTDGESDG